ncbi:MAG: hypothetical protein KAV87_54245 [Desulfobacteraceae bacterium]|nr:hypothetical protein [Desulfobacteraceae bacterium]
MWDMPWTDSATLIAERITEELLKRGHGDFKVAFTLPMNWITAFDILTNFRLQEPFGVDGRDISPEFRGEAGRYYYTESLTYNFMNQKMSIVAVDLQFILRSIMIVAHCGDVAETWATASETDKMYAYVGNCDADSFESDGSPLKIVAPCGVC